MRVLINKENKYLVKNPNADYHSEHGLIKKEDLYKDIAETNKKVSFSVFDAKFIDKYEKIKRGAQIITLKDIGTIIAETGINKDSVVMEAGSGSGALCCFLANICKKVISYDIREEHQKIAIENAEFLKLKNIKFKIGDIKKEVLEKEIDLAVLDMPDPWLALENVSKAVKKGGFIVVYSPTIPQVMDTVNKAKKDLKEMLIFIKTIETIQREWEVDERKVRPFSAYLNHTGFLTFLRRI